MELNEYQRLANQTDQQPETGSFEADPRSILVPLLGLAGEVGELLGEHKKWIRDGDSYKLFPDRVREELGDLLWYLSNVADKHGLTLEDVATHNLDKTQRRWHPSTCNPVRPSLFDEGFPSKERFPRQMDVSIDSEGPGRIVTLINGRKFGDPLRDNRYEDDGYRFHDIFHLSYASVLGWSPTLRALLRCKRKSDPKIDEVEDGGRAIVIEEGIAAMVFSYAERRNFLEGAERQLRTTAHHQGHDLSPGSQPPHRRRLGARDNDGVPHLASSQGQRQRPAHGRPRKRHSRVGGLSFSGLSNATRP